MKILSVFKKEKIPEVEQKTIASPIKGESITSINSLVHSTKDFSIYNPDDLLIKKSNSIYQRMRRDEQIKACLLLKKSSVIARGYNFELDDEDSDQEKIVDFFWEVIEQMTGSFNDKLRGIMSGLENGFSISEKVYKSIMWEKRSYWGIDDIKMKPFDTFLFDIDQFGNTKALKQSAGFTISKYIPIEKVIHWAHQSDINKWYGESDLRSVYRSWWAKDIIIKLQNIHLERHGSSFIIVTPGEKSATDDSVTNKLLTMLKSITARTGFVFPKGYTAQVVSPQNTESFENAIAQHDKAISKALLLPNLLGFSEQGQTGSYAQSQTQFIAFLDLVIEDLCKSIAECLNDQLFAELAFWNFGTTSFPKFKFDPMTKQAKIDLARVWNELKEKGTVINGERDEAYIRGLLGFPEKEEADDKEGPDISGIPNDPEEPINPEPELESNDFTDGIKPWLKRVNFTEIKKSFDDSENEYMFKMTEITAMIKLSLYKQITKIVGNRALDTMTLKDFESIALPKSQLTALRKLTRATLQNVSDKSYAQAEKELPNKSDLKFELPSYKTKIDKFLASKAMKVTSIIDQNVLKIAQRIIENGIKYNKTLKDIIKELDTDSDIILYLPEKIDPITGEWIKVTEPGGRLWGPRKKQLRVNIPARLENIARTNIADAVNQSRQALFSAPENEGFVRAYEYSAILDERVTDICERLHGRIRKDWGNYTPPNHHNCRSILVPVTVIDDWDGKEHSIPSTTEPHKGFK